MTQKAKLKRSGEPIWWALFSAGGVCFAVFIPATIVFLALLMPLGVVELSYSQASTWFFSFWGLLFTGAVVVLPLFHAVHRIRHGLHDLKVQHHGLVKALCYGFASVLSIVCLTFWLLGFLN